MTLPDERYRAVVETKKFLEQLLTTPRIPKVVKDHARWCLRHYPTDFDMRETADKIPEIFAESIEDVRRMMMVYEQSKENEDKSS